MPSSPPLSDPPSFSPARRLGIAASVLVSLASVLTLVGLANYFAQHYAPRLYWGRSSDLRLSALTLGALESLTNQVRITVFFRREHPVYPSVRAVLREYAAASSRLTVEELDYNRNPVEAQEFRRRFPATLVGDEPDVVLFESNSRTKVVAARDLQDYDTAALLRGEGEARPTAFKGEALFTSAINAVCEDRPRKVYFLSGHREHSFRSDEQQVGYRRLAAGLEEDNIEVAALGLNGEDDVPADCQLLVIAGAQDRLTTGELKALDRYLRGGGRLWVLFHYRAQTGLEALLADWGIRAGDSLVLDEENTDNGVLIVSRFGSHPVTRALGNSRLYLFRPRAVEGQPLGTIHGAPARIEALLRSGTNGVVVTTFGPSGYQFTADDRRGEIPLALAVERGSLPGVAASLGTTRILAVGDSRFLANKLIDLAGNHHFAMSSVNWLLDRSHLLGGIPPTPIRLYQVTMTPLQERMLRWFLLLFLPGGALALGAFVWWRRH